MRREKMMKLKIIIEPSADEGYSVIVPSLPGCKAIFGLSIRRLATRPKRILIIVI